MPTRKTKTEKTYWHRLLADAPLVARAKFLMMVQAAASVVIILTIVTRAISSLN